MKTKHQTTEFWKRGLSLLLAIVFCLSIAQQGMWTAYAAEEDGGEPQSSQEAEAEEKADKDDGDDEDDDKGVKTQEDPVTFDATITVQDQDGNAISGVKVELSGLNGEVDTDSSGTGSFTGLTDDSYTVSVSKNGYAVKPGDSWTVDYSNQTVTVTLHKLISYTGTVKKEKLKDDKTGKADETVDAESGDFEISVDGAKNGEGYKAEKGKGTFTLTNILAGTDYTVSVHPTNSKQFDDNASVSLNKVSETTASQTATLELKKVSVKVNGKAFAEPYYGAAVTIQKSDDKLKVSGKDGVEGYELVGIRYGGLNHEFKDKDSLKIENITEDTEVVSVYQYTATFDIGPKGVVTHGGDNVANGRTLSALDSDSEGIKYVVTSREGYYISSVKEGSDNKVGSSKPVEYYGEVFKPTTVTVTFEERHFDVTFALTLNGNSNGAVKVDRTVLNSGTPSKKVSLGEANCYKREGGKDYYEISQTIKVTDEKNYVIQSVKLGDTKLEDDGYGTYTVSGITDAATVTINVGQKDHTITYFDPFISDGGKATQNFRLEDNTVTLRTGTETTGFTFVGWSKTPANGERDSSGSQFVPSTISTSEYNDDLNLYAVYTVNMNEIIPDVTANEGERLVGSNLTGVKSKAAIEASWFGQDVTLTLPENSNLTYEVSDADKVSSNDPYNYIVRRSEGKALQKTVTITGTKTGKYAKDGENQEESYTFAPDSATVLVKIDGEFPELKPDEIKNSTKALTASDADSGLACVQWTETDIADGGTIDEATLEELGGANKIKEALRKLDWETIYYNDGLGGYATQSPKHNHNYVVYRAVDNAGNDVYSVFDTSEPILKAFSLSYTNGEAKKTVDDLFGGFTVVADGELTFTATIEDNMLVYHPQKDQNGNDKEFGNVSLSLKDENEKVYRYSVDEDNATLQKKSGIWNLFNDSWTLTVTAQSNGTGDNENILGVKKNQAKKFTSVTLTATDAMGNTKSWNSADSSPDSYFVIDRTNPTIQVDYSYQDALDGTKDEEANPKLSETQQGPVAKDPSENHMPVYSKGDITATVTVSGTYFDTLGTAAFTVKDGSTVLAQKTENVTSVEGWERSDDGSSWKGTVTLSSEGTHDLIVEATSCAGNPQKYENKQLVIDKTAPVIKVRYKYHNLAEMEAADDDKPKEEGGSVKPQDHYFNSANKVTAVITVTDDYLDPYLGKLGDHSVGKGGHTQVLAALDDNELTDCITWTKVSGDEETTKNAREAQKWVGTLNLNITEGRHMLSVVAYDQAGNQDTYHSANLNNDNEPPVLESVTMSWADSTLTRLLNKLTFGAFFNSRVKLTVTAYDRTKEVPDYSSGVHRIVLSYTGTEGKTVTVESKPTGIKNGKGPSTYTADFYLPYPKEDANAASSALKSPWEANLSLQVFDCADNSSKVTELSKVKSDDDIRSSYVLYENKAPTILQTRKYKDKNDKDKDIYYTYDETDWLMKGESFQATIEDEKQQDARTDENETIELASGLQQVTVTLKHNDTDPKQADDVQTSVLTDAKEKVDDAGNPYIEGTPTMNKTPWIEPAQSGSYFFTADVTIPYDAFTPGHNTVVIQAVDLAGNTHSLTRHVYKDDTLPTITSINLSNNENKTNIRKFGNFYNEDAGFSVGVKDGQYTSGIASTKLVYVSDDGQNVKGKPDEENPKILANTTDSNSGTFKYEVPYSDDTEDTEGHFKIVVTDNVGNQITFGENSDFQISNNVDESMATLTSEEYGGKTNIHKNHLMFEKTPVRIQHAVNRTAEFTCTGDDPDRLWFNSQDIPLLAQLNEVGSKKSGLNRTDVKVNGNAVTKTRDGVPYPKTIGGGYADDEKTTHDEADFNLKDNSGREGENTIEIAARDNAGNNSTPVSFKVYVDTTKPEVVSFNVGGNDAKNVTVTDYGYFFQQDTKVTVMVRDAKPSSGIRRIYFKAVPASNAKPSTKLDTQTGKDYLTQCDLKGTETKAEFTVKANFKGQIYAYVEDNVGNTSLTGGVGKTENWKHPHGPILETQGLHNDLSKIQAELVTKTGSKDKKGQPLYKADAQVKLTVEDPYSGIAKVQYKVVSECDTGKNVDVTSEVKGHSLPGWHVDATDLNLVTQVSRTITVPNNSNDIKVFVYLTDNAGNTSNNEKNPLIFSIDKDAPQITVRYSPAEEGDDPTHTGYFKTDRTMTVTVKERNFDPSLVKVTATKNKGGYNASGSFGGGSRSTEGGIEYFTYTMTHTYHDDGDYTFAIAATDMAGNATEDGQVDYGSAGAKTVAKVFTIDQTLPVVTVDISGNRGDDIYYKGNVVVNVHILEHNYDPNRYEIKMESTDPKTGAVTSAGHPTSGPSNSGDSWSYTYTFTDEYNFQVTSVKVTDKAGNESEGYGGSYRGEHFVVDQTAPVIKLWTSSDLKTKLEHTASNAKQITPAIEITDTNLDAKSTNHYSITLTGNSNGGDLMGKKGYSVKYQPDTKDTGRLIILFNNITSQEEEMLDDIYTLNVAVRDKAGQTSEKSAVFSINRYGSTYMVSNQTNELVKRYFTNKSEDVEIIQINAAPISDQRVTVSKNSTTSQDLVQGKDYNMVYSTPGKGEDGEGGRTDSNWYECRYTLLAKNFEDEVEYSVAVYSKDKADNSLTNFTPNRKNYRFNGKSRKDNAVLDEKKGREDVTAPVVFNVDKTRPQASFIDQKDSDQHFVDSFELPVTASDDKALDYVNVLVDGEVQGTITADEVNAGDATFTLSSDSRMRNVTLVAVDKATNESEQSSIKVQVTRDPIAWYLNNLPAKLVTIIGMLGGAGFFVFKRFRFKAGEQE